MSTTLDKHLTQMSTLSMMSIYTPHFSTPILPPKSPPNFDQFVSRSAAAELLGVTTRTIDRSAKSGKLRTLKRGGRVFFSLTEVQGLSGQWPGSALSTLSTCPNPAVHISTGDSSSDLRGGELESLSEPASIQISHPTGESAIPDSRVGDSALLLQIQRDFRDLVRRQEEFQQTTLQKLQDELREMQTRLEGANFRVGQLEAELRHSVPLLDLTQKTSHIHELEIEVEKLDRQFHDERFSKVLFWVASIVMTGVTVFTLLFW